ncbi:MAG: N-acetyl-gamma-glutamyl-phosphate reductase [Planctomycetes bacterium]|nr:N-acetyl-gamma-glutamyl-phosphate reductase [Planctomycetota bacterium]
MVKVKLVGAGGYGGIGMVEILHRHPQAELAALVDVQDVGKKLSAVWPYLRGFCDLPLIEAGSKAEQQIDADVVIYATPDGVAQRGAAAEVAKGRKVIDYSGDFRFGSIEVYKEYALRQGLNPEHQAPELLNQSVYGLSEFHREAISQAQVVGNPGCFAISCIMGLAPAVKAGCVEKSGIICDCKTGVSGAGKKPAAPFHYPEQYDNSFAYKLAGHQHVMEIEKELSTLAGEEIQVSFTPQVVPMTRGILSTLYGKLPKDMTQKKALSAYQEFYAGDKFVRVLDATEKSGTGQVRGSNYVNIQVACDERTGVFRAISHIDNLVKGQAGSAAQNLNIMFGLEEGLGLDNPGGHP